MASLLAYLRRAGIERGLLEGRRAWMILGLAAWMVRLAQRAVRHEPVVVFREELVPGESLVIRREASAPKGRGRKQR